LYGPVGLIERFPIGREYELDIPASVIDVPIANDPAERRKTIRPLPAKFSARTGSTRRRKNSFVRNTPCNPTVLSTVQLSEQQSGPLRILGHR